MIVMKKVDFLCSDENHPVMEYLIMWKDQNLNNYEISIFKSSSDLKGGDFLFLISCNEIIRENITNLYKHSLVIHASDLPHGRGWSPLSWQILEGKEKIKLSLIEANQKVDTGKIWLQKDMIFSNDMIFEEINKTLFESEIFLINQALKNYHDIEPNKQDKKDGLKTYKKRNPEDSKLDINKDIKSQFNLIRIADPNRYPAFFIIHGRKYKLKLEKYEDD